MKEIELAGKKIYKGTLDPLVIAEIGVNFYDIAEQRGIPPLDAAKLMLKEAIDAGADMAKFQSYKSNTLAAKNSPAYWDTTKETTTSQYELFQKFDKFGEAEYRDLAKYSESLGAPFLSTPFDLEAVDFLADLMPAFKIASADITNIPLLRGIAGKGKPVLLSVGASSIEDIQVALDAIREVDPSLPIVLLQCVLNYPTPAENANLGMIQGVQDAFPDLLVGYSDHTEPSRDMVEILVAVLLGACVIEKHFTLDKTLPGNDHYHAMDPDDLRNLKRQLARIRMLYGSREKIILASEEISVRNARRSIVLKQAVRAGDTLTENHLIMKRPGTGIPPTEIEKIIGAKAVRDLEEDRILEWEDLNIDP
jgi:N-acetylneuraminate synthase